MICLQMERTHLRISEPCAEAQFDEEFMTAVDKIVMQSDGNKDVFETIKKIDAESQKSGMSFYEVFYNLMTVLNSMEQGKEFVVSSE